ncbi:MAG: hypothetical protein R3F07_11190 [Opitutaceae bacterium]
MLELKNDSLRIEILDPVADRHRLGTRFCWGGYVWQIHDSLHGPLLAGPEYPAEPADVFNGQGIPEILRHSVLLSGEPLTVEKGTGGLIMGVGQVDGLMKITNPCAWSINQSPASLACSTRDQALGWGYELTRQLTLEARRLTSRTTLANTGGRTLPVHWFAHPFFPLVDGTLICQLNFPATMPENPGFFLEDGLIRFRRPFRTFEENQFVMLEIGPDTPFDATLSHPTLDGIRMTGDFTLARVPVWANGNTFSIEPYIHRSLEPGEATGWSLTYDFRREIP